MVVGGAGDLLVVGGDNLVVQEEEGGAGVGNTLDGGAGLRANLVAVGGEFPEALGVVDVGVGQGAGVLGAVNEAEVVGAGGIVLQGDGEQRGGQGGLHGVEEGGLGLGLDGVDGAEGQTQETVVVGVLGELGADLGGSLDSLAGGLDGADGDGVLVDVTAGGAAITVGDGPGGAAQLGTVVGLVDGVARLLRGRQLLGEDPAIS